MRLFPKHFTLDWALLILVSMAILTGLMLLYSADHLSMNLPIKQLTKGSLILGVVLGISYLDERKLRELSIPLYLISLALLIFVLYKGYHTKGAQRWLNFYLFRFEPSELVKITLPMALASIIHQQGIPIKGKTLIQACIMILIPFILVLKQPDLGTALILLLIGGITIFVAGLNRKIIYGGVLFIMASLPLFWQMLHSYQQQRIITLFSGDDDLKHHGYHIHQSKIAIGSGGFWGKGLGLGDQVQLGFIPEHKTDFIFTVLSEEFGFFGNILWLCLVVAIGLRCIYLGYKQRNTFNKLVCISLSSAYMLGSWINMSMVCGLLPVVGVPLPFLSYGGTSFVATLAAFALILKLGHTDPRKQHLW